MVGRVWHPWSHHRRFDLRVVLGVTLIVAIVGVAGAWAAVNGKHGWRMIGHDSTNTRSQPFEHTIKPSNVGLLNLKWTATTTGDVSATPAVVDGAVYFGDFGNAPGNTHGGTLWKLDA